MQSSSEGMFRAACSGGDERRTRRDGTMGIFDRKKDDKDPAKPTPKADFSNVQGGSSSTAQTPSRPAPAPTPTGTSGTGFGKSYTVVAGDSLSKIAKREYGDANAWNRIYEANRDIIKDPDLIYPGQSLKIPAKA
jgi:nucleoid-associated protein YgaU